MLVHGVGAIVTANGGHFARFAGMSRPAPEPAARERCQPSAMIRMNAISAIATAMPTTTNGPRLPARGS